MPRLSLQELREANAAKAEENLENADGGQQVDSDADEALDNSDTLDAELEPELDEEPEPEVEETEEGEEGDEATDEDGEEDLNSWFDGEDNSKDNQSVPLKKHAELRKKLRGQMADKDDEISLLRREIEQLKSGNTQPVQQQVAESSQNALPPRPKRSEYVDGFGDVDYDKYDAAVDDWYDKRSEAKQMQTHQQAEQSQAQKQVKEQQEKVINKHYERATQLVEDGKISAEKYKQAESNILQRLEGAAPGMGETYMDGLLTQIDLMAGDKSALVALKLGADANALESVLSAYQTSQNAGLAAIRDIASKINVPGKRTSTAPKPAKEIKGNKGNTPSSNNFKKKVEAARKRGDTQTVISLKRKARVAGLDTKDW